MNDTRDVMSGQAPNAQNAPVALPVVEARGLRRVYRQGVIEVTALDGVDLTLARGEYAALAARHPPARRAHRRR
jgi:hypothetical protein